MAKKCWKSSESVQTPCIWLVVILVNQVNNLLFRVKITACSLRCCRFTKQNFGQISAVAFSHIKLFNLEQQSNGWVERRIGTDLINSDSINVINLKVVWFLFITTPFSSYTLPLVFYAKKQPYNTKTPSKV